MNHYRKNVCIAAIIIFFIVAVCIILTLDDPKGIGKIILYIFLSSIFILAGILSVFLIVKKRINKASIIYNTVLLGNLSCLLVTISQLDIKNSFAIISILCIQLVMNGVLIWFSIVTNKNSL